MAGPVDLIVTRAKVITVDPDFSLAEAVAMGGEHIVAVGGAPLAGYLAAAVGTTVAGWVNLVLLWRATRGFGDEVAIDARLAARWPRIPSDVVQKKSAWSWRTMRLSTSRVSPPVPGSTASIGSSSSDTADEPSSISMMWSHASASS